MKNLATLALAALLSTGSAHADPAAQEYARYANDFGAKVFQRIYQDGKQSENILYSPVSMHFALSMVGHFADSSAQKGMYGALGLQSLTAAQFGESSRRLLAAYKDAETGRYKINIKNGFWLTSELPAASNTTSVKALQRNFDAEFSNSELFTNSKSADTINRWVAEATENKIKNLISAQELAPLHWASVSAIYFEGKWFNKLGQGHGPSFKKPSGGTAKATYMEASPGMGVFSMEKDDVNVYEIAYGEAKNGRPVSEPGALVILQPKNPKTFSKLVEKVNGEYISSVLGGIEEKKKLGKSPYVALNIPAFELDFETGMEPVKDVLVRNGASDLFDAFDMTALHPALTKTMKNKIKLIKQKATITMANEGTTAAAASFVGGGIESMGPRSVYVDSAFIYLIVDRSTKSVLFQGSFVDPEKAKVPEFK